jgi:tape measure domain-containing protein
VAEKEVYRIEIPVEVQDKTAQGLAPAQQRVSGFERVVERTRQALDRLNRGRWKLLLEALDKASPVIGKVLAGASKLAGGVWRVTLRAVDLVTSPIRAIMRLITGPLGLVGAAGGLYGGVLVPLQMADDLTRATRGFETFLGSAQKAKDFLAQLQQFGADTPLESDDITKMATQLLPAFNGNAEMVMRTLKAFGDAASLTGAGVDGMKLSLLGFRQISAIGTLTMEELRQVTENLQVPMTAIIEELGIAQKDLRNIGEKGIPASKAMEAILRALERPVSKGGFLGGMATMMDTLGGQWAMLRDTFKINVAQRWGKGLESGLLPFLKRLTAGFSANTETTKQWGDTLETIGRDASTWLVQRADMVHDALARAINSDEFRQADGFWAKFKIVWNKVIVEPFDAWYRSGGQKWIEDKAGMVGKAFGGALGGFFASVLGLASGDAKDNSFISAGTTAGKAFLGSFLDAFDAGRITGKLMEAFVNLQGTPLGILLDLYLAKKGVDMYKGARDLLNPPKGPVSTPSLPGGGGCCCGQPGMPGVPGGQNAPSAPSVPTILGPDGKPLPPSTAPNVPPGAPAAPAAMTAGELLGSIGLGALAGVVAAAALSKGSEALFKWSNARHEAAKDKAIADSPFALNPSEEQKALRAQALGPTTIGQAGPQFSFWETWFTGNMYKYRKINEWNEQQAKALKEAQERLALTSGPVQGPPIPWWAQEPSGTSDVADALFEKRLQRAMESGQVPVTSAPVETKQTFEIKIDNAPTYQVETAADAEAVLAIIRQHNSALADEVADRLAETLGSSFNNRPKLRPQVAMTAD